MKNYWASEIDPSAIAIAKRNYPSTKHLGSVKDVKGLSEPLDLLIGGSPCQDLSVAKQKREGLKGAQSGLFYEYLRLLRALKPKWFILENVASMSKDARDTITKELGVEPILIDAALVSAQSRKRLFWTNIPGVRLPSDRGIKLKDILEADPEDSYFIKGGLTVDVSGVCCARNIGRRLKDGVRKDYDKSIAIERRIECREDGKSGTLTKVQKDNLIVKGNTLRRLTPTECERLQSLPDGYTAGVANTNRYKCLGNAFNVEVIKHILSHIPV